MLKLKTWLIFFGLTWLAVAYGNARKFANQHKRAIEFYDAGDYGKAAKLYEQIIAEGLDSKEAYYNLGNCYFRLDQTGKAIAAYLAARRIDPNDPNVKANLNFVMKSNQDKLSATPKSTLTQTLLGWTTVLTLKSWLKMTSVLLSLGLIMLLLQAWWLSLADALQVSNRIFLTAAVFCGVMSGIRHRQQQEWGAITRNESTVHSGPSLDNTVLFKLSEGAPFLAKDRQNGWLLIELSDGKIGWLEAPAAAIYPTNRQETTAAVPHPSFSQHP